MPETTKKELAIELITHSDGCELNFKDKNGEVVHAQPVSLDDLSALVMQIFNAELFAKHEMFATLFYAEERHMRELDRRIAEIREWMNSVIESMPRDQ